MSLPSKVRFTKKTTDLLSQWIKKYKRIAKIAHEKWVNESDTSWIIQDLIWDFFWFEKFFEITTEYKIKNQYCDLWVKIDDKLKYLIEVKSIKCELSNNHAIQAWNYASNEWIERVVLTNLKEWRVYHMSFGKKVEQDMFLKVDILEESKMAKIMEVLLFLTKESFKKKNIDKMREQKNIASIENVKDIVVSQPIVKKVQLEIKRLSWLKVPLLEIENVLNTIISK